MPFRRTPALALALALALAAVALAPTPAHAGPPWISVELPVNPHDPATRDALVVVHTYHHGQAEPQTITCTLEGIVDGARRTVACRAEPTSRPAVYAILGVVPARGVWMLVVTGREGTAQSATVLVDYGRDRQIAAVRVPTRKAEGGRWTIPTPVPPQDIDRMLQSRWTVLGRADGGPSRDRAGLVTLGASALALLAFVSRRRMT